MKKALIVKFLIATLILLFFNSLRAEQIVLIGDSHLCGAFGKSLFQNLSKTYDEVSLYCAVSSAPEHWLKGSNPIGQICSQMTTKDSNLSPCIDSGRVPKLEQILTQYPRAKFVVALGTNSLLSPEVSAEYNKLALKITESGNACFWIGPPHLNPSQSKGFPAGRIATEEKNLNDFYESLMKAIGTKCKQIDSRDSTSVNTAGNQTVDGVHRTKEAAEYWAVALKSEFSNSDPINQIDIKKLLNKIKNPFD